MPIFSVWLTTQDRPNLHIEPGAEVHQGHVHLDRVRCGRTDFHPTQRESAACLSFSCDVLTGQAFLLNMINRRRAEQIAQGAEKQPHLGDQNPHFK